MRLWSIILALALFGFVAYAHPHPRRIERSVVGVQNPDLLRVGILDAGIVLTHEAQIGNLSTNEVLAGNLDAGRIDVAVFNVKDSLVSGGTLTYMGTLCFDSVEACGSYMNLTGGVIDIYLQNQRLDIQADGSNGFDFSLGVDGGSKTWGGMEIRSGGIEFSSGTGMLMESGSALESHGTNRLDTQISGEIDAGVVYFGNLASPTADFVIGTWGGGDGAGPAAENENMGPAHETGAFPAKIGNIGFMWKAAGTGGTNGVQAVVYEYPSGPELCSCFVGPCTAAAKSWSKCSCGTRMGASKTYVVRVGGGTDCAANPSDITFGAQLLR